MVIMQLPRGRGMNVKCVLRFHLSCLTSAGARCQLMGRAVEKEVSKRGKLHASQRVDQRQCQWCCADLALPPGTGCRVFSS